MRVNLKEMKPAIKIKKNNVGKNEFANRTGLELGSFLFSNSLQGHFSLRDTMSAIPSVLIVKIARAVSLWSRRQHAVRIPNVGLRFFDRTFLYKHSSSNYMPLLKYHTYLCTRIFIVSTSIEDIKGKVTRSNLIATC